MGKAQIELLWGKKFVPQGLYRGRAYGAKRKRMYTAEQLFLACLPSSAEHNIQKSFHILPSLRSVVALSPTVGAHFFQEEMSCLEYS